MASGTQACALPCHHDHPHGELVAPGVRHRHVHTHEPLTHTHEHYPDAHHRHEH